MGSTFNPSMLMDFLQKNSGQSASADTPPLQPPPASQSGNMTPIADISQPSGGQVPQLAPPQAAKPDQRIQGIKGYLSNILYDVGEGMKTHLGMETDAQKQQRLYTQDLQNRKFSLEQANLQSEIMQRAAQVKQMQSMVTLPNGMQVPFALAKPYIEAQAKVQAATTGKRYMVVPNVGLMDTQSEGGPKLVPGSSPQGVTVTQDMVTSNGIPAQLVGTTIPLGQFAQLERGGAAWAGNVSNTTETKVITDPKTGQDVLAQIPKTTTSQKVALGTPKTSVPPSPGSPTAPSASIPPVKMQTRGGVRILTGSDGQPLMPKSGSDTVYATDQKTGQQIFTTRKDAVAQGLQTPMKVSATEVRKDQALSNRLADVQRKVGDYAETFSQPLDTQDRIAISYLMDNNIGAGLSTHGISVSILPQYIQSQLKARGMQALSEAGMKRYIQFNQARESLSGYQQILTNSSRSSDKVLELQLEQLPPPIADEQFANMATGEFQKNIDLAGQHVPIFPGSAETQQSIKSEQAQRRAQAAAIQANQQRGAQAQQAAPPRPSNVPANYVYKANGPKGAGWYKP